MLRIELTRAVMRAMPALMPDARDLLLAMDDEMVEAAMKKPDRGLGSLDAWPFVAHGLLTFECTEVTPLPQDGFASHFAADVDPAKASVMCTRYSSRRRR